MHVAVMLLHTDCVTITQNNPSPPKMQLIGVEGRLYGRCPACSAWVVVDIAPTDAPQGAAVEIPVAIGT